MSSLFQVPHTPFISLKGEPTLCPTCSVSRPFHLRFSSLSPTLSPGPEIKSRGTPLWTQRLVRETGSYTLPTNYIEKIPELDRYIPSLSLRVTLYGWCTLSSEMGEDVFHWDSVLKSCLGGVHTRKSLCRRFLCVSILRPLRP